MRGRPPRSELASSEALQSARRGFFFAQLWPIRFSSMARSHGASSLYNRSNTILGLKFGTRIEELRALAYVKVTKKVSKIAIGGGGGATLPHDILQKQISKNLYFESFSRLLELQFLPYRSDSI